MATYSLANFAYQAARDLGCIRSGQTLSTDVLNDILAAANEWLDSLLIEDTTIPASPPATYTLTAGQQIYTIGPNEASPNFTGPRPTQIDDANIILNTFTPVLRQPLECINVDQWADIRVQQLPSAIPKRLYYETSFSRTPTVGAARLMMWPGPLTSYQLELFTPDQTVLAAFPDLNTAYAYPPGYALMIRKNLAVQIAPLMTMYAKSARTGNVMAPPAEMLAEVRRQAVEAMNRVTSNNADDPILTADPAYRGASSKALFNYLDGSVSRKGY